MSTALALASVTALLKDLLDNGLARGGITSQLGADATVSATPPDRISAGADEKPQLNLFLYHVTPRTGLARPAGMMSGGAPGNGVVPLALELHYLISAYGGQDYQTEILLGHALRVLHETPVLDAKRIRDTLGALAKPARGRVIPPPVAALAASDLAERVTRIQIQEEFLSLEEISKLWSALQGKYRPSATYKVTAVIIDGDGAA